MYCYYVCIGMKWPSLFILPEVHYATADMITAGLLWQSPASSLLWPLHVHQHVCANVAKPSLSQIEKAWLDIHLKGVERRSVKSLKNGTTERETSLKLERAI